MPPQPPLLDLAAVAARLRVSVRTVERLIARRELAVVRVGRQRRVDPRALDAYVRSNSE